MGKCIIMTSGLGLDPDELTATAGDILKGKKAGVQGSDEPVVGTLELSGTAADSQVLAGQTYYNTDAKAKRTGTMVNRGAVSQALNAGGNYTIPSGYHNGSGRVTVNSLSSQTSATANAGQILSGQTAWVNGNKLTGTMVNRGQAQNGGGWGAGADYYAINDIPEGAYFKNGADWAPEARLSKTKVRDALGVTANKILKGQWIAEIAGTATSDANATAADIFTGKTAYVNGNKLTGTMANRGTQNGTLNCGGVYTIAQGYHNGNGRITANSLSSQTSATATAAKIIKGQTAWVNGVKITGTLEVQSAINFSVAAPTYNSIQLSWKNPDKGPFSGVQIRVSTGGYPGPNGGNVIYTGTGNTVSAGAVSSIWWNATRNTTYYFTLTTYVTGLGNGTSINAKCSTPDSKIWVSGENYIGANYGVWGPFTIDANRSVLHYNITNSATTGDRGKVFLGLAANGNWDTLFKTEIPTVTIYGGDSGNWKIDCSRLIGVQVWVKVAPYQQGSSICTVHSLYFDIE